RSAARVAAADLGRRSAPPDRERADRYAPEFSLMPLFEASFAANSLRQQGQATVWMVMLTLVFGLLFGLLSDGAVLFADHRRAEQRADSGARAGASQLDAVALRNAPTQPPRLDPAGAQLKARQYVTDHEPEATVETEATPVAIVVRVHLL